MDERFINPYVIRHKTGRSHGNGYSLELLTILYAVLAATLGWDGAAVSVSSRPSLEAVEAKPVAIAIPCAHRAVVHRPSIVLALPSLADLAHIICEGRRFLVPGGVMLLEHGWTQGEAVRELFREAGYLGVSTCRDYGDNERLTLGLIPGGTHEPV